MKFISTVALAFASLVAASPVTRDGGPTCEFNVVPKDAKYGVGAANQLTYGFLVKMSKSVPGTTISYTSSGGPRVTATNADGTYTVTSGLTVDGKTFDEISNIITETWPQTWVWEDGDPGYNWFINSATC
ncbi:hypothetical protein CYLTODRAFT_446453 [Cylindrobasidium torrendii FP15055 ss-10]|uniref:Uncharacterized protein n=1 Tax=Cylindrobasidium torrendii FP15055 ss-10 TaxID=1314674 RepID=A0A0D7B0I9_9AGAR|nr:hypothetical protein CYLTODRAFT_446453 [Cylindrobasidium torrendii FP15055 ss-10]